MAANLIIRASDLGISSRDSNLRIFSRKAGNAGSLPIDTRGNSSVVVDFDFTGVFSVNLPSSDEFDQPQEYAIYNGGTFLGVFSIPGDISSLVLDYTQVRRSLSPITVPAILSEEEPLNPAEGEFWLKIPSDPNNISLGDYVLSVRHSAEWVPISGAGGGTGGGGSTVIYTSRYDITPASNNVSIPTGSGHSVDITAFTTAENSTNLENSRTRYEGSKGIRILEDGIYTVNMRFPLQLVASPAGEWGIVLKRTNGETGNDEIIHDEVIRSDHTDAITGASETIDFTLQIPLSSFAEDDFINAAFTFQHSESSSQTVSYVIASGGYFDIRRYVGEVGAQQRGLNQSQVDARIIAGVRGFALAGSGGIRREDLDSQLRSEIDDAVPYDAITLNGRDLRFISHGGVEYTDITIPGIFIEKDPAFLSNIQEIQFAGDGVTVARVAGDTNRALVTITGGGGGGGGLSTGQVNNLIASNPNVIALQHFERALRRTRSLGQATLTSTTANQASPLNGIVIPTVSYNTILMVSVDGVNYELDLSDLLAKPAVVSGDALNINNSLMFTHNSQVFRIAHDNTDGVFGSIDAVDASILVFSVDELDVFDFIRRSLSVLVPANKLGSGSANRNSILYGDQVWRAAPGGLNQGAVDLRVALKTDPLEIRVDQIEEFEETFRTRTVVANNVQISVGTANVAYSLGNTVKMLTSDTAGAKVEITVRATGEPDGEGVFDLTDLLNKARIVRANTSIGTTNAVLIVNAPDNNRYYIGIDTGGDVFFGSDTIDTYTITVAYTIIEDQGLSISEVRDQTRQQLIGGTNVTITPSGSGASQVLTISASGGTGGTPNAVTLDTSGFSSSDDGTFPTWNNGDSAFDSGMLGDSDEIKAEYDTSTATWSLKPKDKLEDLLKAINYPGWANVNGTAAQVPFVTNSSQTEPTGITGHTFQISGTNPTAFSNARWLVTRFPTGLEFKTTRYRLAVDIDNPGDVSYVSMDDATQVTLLGTDSTYTYYKIGVNPGIGGNERFQIQHFSELSFIKDYFDLTSDELSDFIQLADRTAANDGKFVRYNNTNANFELADVPAASPATTEVSGTVELATNAEMDSGAAGKIPDAAQVKNYADNLPQPHTIGQQFNNISAGYTNVNRVDAFLTGNGLLKLQTGTNTNFKIKSTDIGEFHIELDFTLTAPADSQNNTFGIVTNPTAGDASDKTGTFSQIIFATDLLGTTAFSGGTIDGRRVGEDIARIPIYGNTTKQADVIFRLAHEDVTGDDDDVGVSVEFDNIAGTLLPSWTANLRISWTPSDSSSAAGDYTLWVGTATQFASETRVANRLYFVSG